MQGHKLRPVEKQNQSYSWTNGCHRVPLHELVWITENSRPPRISAIRFAHRRSPHVLPSQLLWAWQPFREFLQLDHLLPGERRHHLEEGLDREARPSAAETTFASPVRRKIFSSQVFLLLTTTKKIIKFLHRIGMRENWKKKKLVGWYVARCGSKNKREGYINELRVLFSK